MAVESWVQASWRHLLKVVTRREFVIVTIYGIVVAMLFRYINWNMLGKGTRKQVILGHRVELTKEESNIMQSVINPANLTDDFDDIGGLSDVKQELTENIIWPFNNPDAFEGTSMGSLPSGLLLYGPPGTGKTMLARALAKQVNGHFISVQMDSLFGRYVGDSEKAAAAYFTLAHKLQPAILFVDEIDTLLSTRKDGDSEVYAHTKNIFLTSWDGINKNSKSRVLVVGATNRKWTLDAAVRRRLPIQLEVPHPCEEGRLQIFKIMLRSDLESAPELESKLGEVVRQTKGFTGSHISQVCKTANLARARHFFAKNGGANNVTTRISSEPMTVDHLLEAVRKLRGSSEAPLDPRSASALGYDVE